MEYSLKEFLGKNFKYLHQFNSFIRYLNEDDKIEFEKEVRTMSLNILFFTISIKKRDISLEVALHREMVENRMQENWDRYFQNFGK